MSDLRARGEEEAGYCENVAEYGRALLPHEVPRVARCLRDLVDALTRIAQTAANNFSVAVENAERASKAEVELAAARQAIATLLAYVQHGRTCQRWSEAWEWPIVLNHGKPCTCGLAALTAPEAKGMREDAP